MEIDAIIASLSARLVLLSTCTCALEGAAFGGNSESLSSSAAAVVAADTSDSYFFGVEDGEEERDLGNGGSGGGGLFGAVGSAILSDREYENKK